MTGSTVKSVRSRQLPSVLLKETPVDPDIFDRRDPLEKFFDRNRDLMSKHVKGKAVGSFEDHIDEDEKQENEIDVSRMSLDEYLRRYTSEDNQAFQELHDKDREAFLKKISWMFNENEKY